MVDLRCELYGTHVGQLHGDSYLNADLHVSSDALDRWGLGSPILSVAIPLAISLRRGHAARRRAFFSALLPEGRPLTRIAERMGTHESDSLRILAGYGRDLAGALQIFDERESAPSTPGRSEPLDDPAVAALLRDSTQPLGNRPLSGKTSLAGVQEKIVLARHTGCWHQVYGGEPSTHILKPIPAEWPTMIFDEEYGHRIATRLGLCGYRVEVRDFAGTPALAVERFDRDPGVPGGRIHVEDFAAALGVVGRAKYEEHGGGATLARCAAIVQEYATPEDVRALSRVLVVAVALGNLDMHAKNLSILHPDDGSIALAPVYDMVPMAHQPTDGRMAMAVGGTYEHAKITAAMLIAEIGSWGVPQPDDLVEATLAEITDAIADEDPADGAHVGVRDDITTFVERLRRGEACGPPVSLTGSRRDAS